jgi:patatin-related protein
VDSGEHISEDKAASSSRTPTNRQQPTTGGPCESKSPAPVTHEQEVHFALVLYGGVSLAVYINGVMEEMLQLVRSTSGLPNLKGSAKVYRKLGAMLGHVRPSATSPSSTIPDSAAIKTKFNVDIISGTSAGGINGIFLAKALVNGAENLGAIAQLWYDEGAIDALLNDSKSYNFGVSEPDGTKSLLNSRRMYSKLLKAFDSMDPATGAPLAQEIDLFATTTDIEGVPVPIQLFDNVVWERRHRNAFHLRYEPADTAGGLDRNDFEPDNNPFLAFAARCTSSFPFAFEPMQLCNIDEILRADRDYVRKTYCWSKSSRWQKFYTNYLQPAQGATPTAVTGEATDQRQSVLETATPFPQRAFGDGGYLNNAPFSYAVDALLKRHAPVPVDRKLLYVEPSPAHPECEPNARTVPNALQNSLDALVTIPGYQTIRNDLLRVLERNRQATKINKTLSEVENEIQGGGVQCIVPRGAVEEIWFQPDSCYRAYYRMRAAEITDDLALMLARIYGVEESSAYFAALRSVVRKWRQDRIGTYKSRSAGPRSEEDGLQRFLREFDLPYRVRRLRFILRKMDGLYNLNLPPEHPSHHAAWTIVDFPEKPKQGSPERSNEATRVLVQVGAVRSQSYEQYRRLFDLLKRLLRPPLPEDFDTPKVPEQPEPHEDGKRPALLTRFWPFRPKKKAARTGRVPDVLAEVRNALPKDRGLMLGLLRDILGETDSRPADSNDRFKTSPISRRVFEPADLEILCDQRAEVLMDAHPELRAALNESANRLAGLLKGELAHVQQELDKIFASPTAHEVGQIAKRFYHCFDLFDGIQYPMAFNTDVSEAEVVQIVRVAPEDATVLGPASDRERRAKLKGLIAGHFGAFLDKDWRRSDLLWGRLDAAERLIKALLPWDELAQPRDTLIDEAQHEILEDFKARGLLLDMAQRVAVHCNPAARISDANMKELMDAAASLKCGPHRRLHQQFMSAWQNTVPQEPDRTMLARALARATEITGRILDRTADPLKPTAAALTRAGRVMWGLVEISAPRSLGRLLADYWQTLLLLIAIILFLAGTVFGQQGVTGVALVLLGFSAALFTARALLGAWLRKTNWQRTVAIFVIAVVAIIAALAGWGGYHIYQWLVDGFGPWLIEHARKLFHVA